MNTVFTSLQEMAASSAIDAVYDVVFAAVDGTNSHLYAVRYIASPTSCHAAHCIIFLLQGKHVLCEKPVVTNAAELEQVLACATAHGAAFMEGMRPGKSWPQSQNSQLANDSRDSAGFTPNFEVTRQAISSGRLGAIRHFLGAFCQLSSRYPQYLRGERVNAFQPEFSNGALMDIGC